MDEVELLPLISMVYVFALREALDDHDADRLCRKWRAASYFEYFTPPYSSCKAICVNPEWMKHDRRIFHIVT